MTTTDLPGGLFRLAEDLELTRVGYGAMQLAGPGVLGPPRDRDAAVAVLRAAVELGITHIDTAEFYVPASPTSSSARRSRRTRTTCTSSPRSARVATRRVVGRTRASPSSCAPRCTTTCGDWAWTPSTS